MQIVSILTEAFLAPILAEAQHNLATDGYVVPVLFIKPASGTPWMTAPDLPAQSADRHRYFTKLGEQLRHSGVVMQEAVLLMESWFVTTKQAPGGLIVRPSRHPERREAIILSGRNADHSRETQVIQPFRRGSENQFVWEDRPLAVYNQRVGKHSRAVGLLDPLFAAAVGQ